MKRVAVVVGRIAYWLGWPMWWMLLRHGERARVVLFCEGKLLLEQSYIGSGAWGLPGGGIHSGEDPIDAAIREIYEETGIALNSTDVVYLASFVSKQHGLSYKAHYYVSTIQPGTPMTPQRFEIAALKWFSLNELAQFPVLPNVKQALCYTKA